MKWPPANAVGELCEAQTPIGRFLLGSLRVSRSARPRTLVHAAVLSLLFAAGRAGADDTPSPEASRPDSAPPEAAPSEAAPTTPSSVPESSPAESAPPESNAESAKPEDTLPNTDQPTPTVKFRPQRPTTPASLRFDGGWSARKVVSLPVTGGDIGFGVGAQPSEHAAIAGVGRLFFGSTENGLSVFSVSVAFEPELIIGRFRIGVGIGGFVLGVKRFARDETLLSWGPAAHGATRFDIVRGDSFALFVRAVLFAGYDAYAHSGYWGPTFGGGFDFDVAGSRARLSKQ